jgi:hypothetical protein
MIFAVSFEIIIQRAVGNESCYPMKNTLIITALSSRSRSVNQIKLYVFIIGGSTSSVTITINVSGILGILIVIAAISFMIYNKYSGNTNIEVQVEEPFQLQNLIDQIRQTTLLDRCYKGNPEEEEEEEEEEKEE